jgi:hypothetical protein
MYLPIFQGILSTAGPWQAQFVRSGYRVRFFQQGGLVSADSTDTTIPLYDVGRIQASDYIMVCSKQSDGNANAWTPSVSSIRQVSSVDSDIQITVAAAVTVNEGDLILCLGADTGGATPNYDGSLVTLYEDRTGTSAMTTDYVTTGDDGSFYAFADAEWDNSFVLVNDASETPWSVLGWFQAQKSGEFVVLSKAVTYTAKPFECLLLTSGAGGITITLPTAPQPNDQVILKKVDAGVGAVTVTGTVDGGSISLTTQWDVAHLISDGSNWFLVSNA